MGQLYERGSRAGRGTGFLPDGAYFFAAQSRGQPKGVGCPTAGITTASVSQTVKEMGLTGYLKKEADDKDLRYVRLYLTEKGEACAKEIREAIHQADARVSAQLTWEKEKHMRELLDELARIIETELPLC